MGFLHRIFVRLRHVADASLANEALDATEYINHIERHFNVEITSNEAESLATLADLNALVAQKLDAAQLSAGTEGIWANVRRITSFEMGVREADLSLATRFIEDLHC